ncbi:TIGR02556 family CRISPR-associated protein [Clostridium sp. Cult2]|uniref:TIGR02556 family CRISPR-associated protein n=1 Tax=Clostridium sp. Cult2 TaxID=2079003 RepID=UPI001F00FEDD|nr:TIGR02556 family CRISPR-associated protein [Clostridium sp. Cult2]MCF6464461.1 TIGR02556 family CRISPR-associated protein [Clostridium sp. Cult2]
MLEGVIQAGDALLKSDDLISNFILELQPERRNKQLNVLKFKFDTNNGSMEIDVSEEMDNRTAEKYRYVGSADGPNSPQWYASSTSSNYHLTETFYNLTNIDFGKDLNLKIKQIFENFYVDFGEKLRPKYRYAIDLNKLGIIDTTMDELLQKIKDDVENEKDLGKKLLDKIKNEFENYLNEKMNISPRDIGLYTIFVNEEPLANIKKYENMVVEAKKSKTKKSKSKNRGICNICGTNENVSSDMTKMKIKYYTTNQVIFASNVDKKNYNKNMQMCADCMFKYLAGENYILNNMRTKLATFDVYIIPQFIYGEPLDEEELNIAAKEIMNSFNTVKSAEGIEKFRNEIAGSLELRNEDSYFLLNFIFFKSSQQATKIQRLVKDVNPSIFEKIRLASNNAMADFTSILGHKFSGSITLSTVYYMNPVRQSKGEATKYRDVLETYDAVLTGKNLNKNHLINNLNQCVKIIRFEKQSYNINPDKERLEFFIMRANMYIKFLEYLGCLKEGKSLDVSSLNVKDHIKKYIEKVGYGEQETAMFLLGYLIGEIGNKQYKRPGGEGNKPILNKINFNGIDKSKIKRLVNDVFNKLNQEKIRSFNEVTFFEMKRLLDSNIDSWNLNKDESLFYLLSGYSYATTLPMLKEDGSNDK